MTYYKVAKTEKGKEFIYSNKFAIACKTKATAKRLCEYLNKYKNTLKNDWKLTDNELFNIYECDQYNNEPFYQLVSLGAKGLKIKTFDLC